MTKTKGQIFISGENYTFTQDFVDSIKHKTTSNNKTWEVNDIRNLLIDNDVFVIRSLLKLYSFQTEEEKLESDAVVKNNKGFNSYDSKVLSPICETIIKTKRISKNRVKFVKSKLMKYAKQLTLVANNNI